MQQHSLISELMTWRDTNVIKYKKQILEINAAITGRICYSKNLYTLIFLREKLGKNFKVYLETGSLFGASLILMMLTKNPATYIGVDLFDGYYGNHKDPVTGVKPTLDIVKENIDKTNKFKQKYHLLQGSSYGSATLNKFVELGLKIDLLFIDGDHSYYGATADFINYYPFLNKGAYILFDNYTDWPGVKKAIQSLNFNELKCEDIGEFKTGYIIKYIG